MNLVLVAVVVWWLSTGTGLRDLRACPSYMKCLLLFSAVPVVAIFTSDLATPGELAAEISGAVKIGIALLPAYALAKTRWSGAGSTLRITTALTAGGLVACVFGLALWNPADLQYPPFPNSGGPNHTALYMVPVLAAAIAFAWTGGTVPMAYSLVTLVVLLSVSILLRSLTGFLVTACVVAFCAYISISGKRYRIIVGVAACFAVVTLGFTAGVPGAGDYWAPLKQEVGDRVHGDNKTSSRAEILRTALEIWDDHPWFGAGFDQFERATSEARTRLKLQEDGRSYDREKRRFFHASDGHNIFTHTLVERGLVGFFLVAAFFALSGATVFGAARRAVRRAAADTVSAQLAILSVGAWTMMFVGGLGNTTLHDENGLVGAMLLVWSVTALDRRLTAFGVEGAGPAPAGSYRDRR